MENHLLKEFEEELKYRIDRNSLKIKVDSYLGEFEDIKEFEKTLTTAPRVLIDFTGERYINHSQREVTYDIYFINRTSNKDQVYRDACKHALFDLIEEIDSLLIDTKFNHGFMIEPLQIKKIYEGVSNYGYLSIYSRSIKTTLMENDPNLSELEEPFLSYFHKKKEI